MTKAIIEVAGGEAVKPGDEVLAVGYPDPVLYWTDWTQHHMIAGNAPWTLDFFTKNYPEDDGWMFRVLRNHNVKAVASPQSKPGVGHYPHTCPRCSGPAYIGFTSVECQRGCG